MKTKILFFSVLILTCIFCIYFIIQTPKNELIIKNIPTGTMPINNTQLTSIVINTEKSGDKTMIDLANGLSFIDYNSTIKSGDSIMISGTIIKPVCSLYIENKDKKILLNNTIVKIITYQDPKCIGENNMFEFTGWKKLNQK